LLTPSTAIYLPGATSFDSNLLSCLGDAYGTEIILAAKQTVQTFAVNGTNDTPKGPYLAYVSGSSFTLGPVYRVYRDHLQAFMSSIIQDGRDGKFRYANVNTLSDSTLGIPVPSRLYSLNKTTEAKPFEGIRVSVKDIIDVEGIKTSNGNRAWFDLYEAKNASAPAIQKLVEKGAVIIGKTKTSQFANSDRPTADWVDYQYVRPLWL
jgi:hypothetical protein